MIRVKETMKLNNNYTVLICDMFNDNIVTDKIESNLGIHENFEVEGVKACFSIPKSRNIVIFDNLEGNDIRAIRFL